MSVRAWRTPAAVPEPSVAAPRHRAVWFDATGVRGRGADVILALQNTRVDTFLVRAGQLAEFQGSSGRLHFVVHVETNDELDGLNGQHTVASTNGDVLGRAAARGFPTALLATIHDPDSLEQAIDLASRCRFLVATLVDSTNIPLELVIARLASAGTALFKRVHDTEAALVAFGTLECGADGVLLDTRDPTEVHRLEEAQRLDEHVRTPLVTATVTGVRYLGMGHRACVDTTSMMAANEGCVVGSTSAGGLLACAEVHPLPYMELRPFRVNAGAIHSYIWIPDGRLAYLSELKAGSRVLCVSTDGTARPVVVGRTKIEVRPLLLVEAVHDETILNAIVQDDWHIRLFAADGAPVSVTTLKQGQPLLAHRSAPGRHVGLPFTETILER